MITMPVQVQEQTPTFAAAAPSERQRRRPGRRPLLVLIVVAAAGAGAAVSAVTTVALLGRPTIVVATAAPFQSPLSTSPKVTKIGAVAAVVRPEVVAITVTTTEEDEGGSGVVIRSDGIILTADHVIAKARTITVTLDDGRTSPAQVLGRAPHRDLAVIQADRLRGLTPAAFGSARNLEVGDNVLVFGAPLGFAGTVTRGIVSAMHRAIPIGEQPEVDPVLGTLSWPAPTAFVHEAIQTDAAVNPGNSGGPLVDMSARVVGIMTSVVSPETADPDSGVSFAIPSDLAWPVAQRLLARSGQ